MAQIATHIPLEEEARPTVDTVAAAHYLHLSPQYLRRWASTESGPIRPIRLPGCRALHWRVADIRRLLEVSK